MLVAAFMAMAFSLNAQVFDLTTGTGSVGSYDPLWKVKVPGSSTFNSVKISTGQIQYSSGGTPVTAYKQDNCGRWISPHVNSNNHIYSTVSNQETYTYKRTFNVSGSCITGNAIVNITWIAADNKVNPTGAFRVNGVSYNLPSGITHISPKSTSFSVNNIVSGTNTIEVDVYNSESFTALQICGNINVTKGLRVPQSLDCCNANAGQILSWASVPGATGYDVILTYNDPKCCREGGIQTSAIYTTNQNALILPQLNSNCFSWKVRAKNSNDCLSEYSETQCSCGSRETKERRSSSTDAGIIIKKTSSLEITASPNPANNTFTIQMHDHSNEVELLNAIISIVDFSGKEVYNSTISVEEAKEINVSNLASGMYLYKIIDADKNELIKSDKLVIE